MPAPRREQFHSAGFVGALLGIVAALFVRPPMTRSPSGRILWLLAWCGAGLASGELIQAILDRTSGGRSV
jgi:hypothetical protein